MMVAEVVVVAVDTVDNGDTGDTVEVQGGVGGNTAEGGGRGKFSLTRKVVVIQSKLILHFLFHSLPLDQACPPSVQPILRCDIRLCTYFL